MKKKLLYVCPHLSTGGQPQYTYKQIQSFLNDFEIQVVEVVNAGGDAYVVQKNNIKSIVTLHTLGDDKSEILGIIEKYNPDIIHFQEIPQFDLPESVLNVIFNTNRKYFIVVTTHSSNTNPSDIKYHPDRYVLVSKWSMQKFESTGIETVVWEYPVEYQNPDRTKAKYKLGLDPDWKHVLNVGLFTPGKNQAEIFLVAKQLEKYRIKFHFVGNQAMNFENYWSPLMEVKPDNCIIWGERCDVDLFYEACDLFYFASKFELNPLSVKEALGWQLPCFIRRLPTYLDMYDNNSLVTYINDDINLTKNHIINTLGVEIIEIPGWFNYNDIYDEMVEKSDNGAVFVEIGAWFGKSTNYLSKKIKESNKNIQFTTIDTWKGTDDETYHKDVVALHSGDIFYEFIDNTIIANNYGDFKYIKDTSKNAANHFELNSIDFIMIDAGHSYDDVICDLNNWYHKIKSGGYISGDDYTTFSGVKDAVNDFFYSQFELRNCSFFRRKPRIQIKHLLSVPNDMREIVSKSSIEQLKKYGISYEQHINTPYDGMAPYEHCRRPGHISKDNIPGEIRDNPGLGMITGRHYGCYLAHINALKSIDDENYDYTLIFESDAYIYTGLHEFVDIINKACFISERDDVYYISLSNNQSSLDKIRIDSLFSNAPHQTLAHAYLIPNRTKSWWMDRIVDSEWDVADLWYNHVFCHHPKNRYTTNKIYCMQSDGISLLDNNFKKWNT